MRPFSWMQRGPLRNADPGASGGGGGGTGTPPAPAAFDAAAFQTHLLGEVGKMLGDLKASLKPGEPPPPPSKPEPKGDGGAGHDPAALMARINELEAQRAKDAADAKTAREAARDRDRMAQIRTHLSGHQLANEAAAEDALNVFGGRLKFNDQDQLVTPNGKPVKDYISETLANERPYLLKPRDVGGAGAANGGGGASGGKALDLDDIKPGMSAEQMKAFEVQLSQMMRRQ